MYANPAAEHAAVGLLMLDPDVMVKTKLDPEHFADPDCRLIWDKAQQALARNLPFTSTDVFDLDPKLFAKVNEWMAEVVSVTNLPSYEASILDNYWRRQAAQSATKLAQAADDRSLTVDDLRAVAAAFASNGRSTEEGTVTADAFVSDFRYMLDGFAQRNESGFLATWPWRAWQNMLDPMEQGMLYALGAASSTGKTTALECEAEHLARIGYRVAFVHLELSHRTMMQRAYARNAGVSMHAQRTGSLTEDEWAAVRKYEYERDNLWPGEVIYLHAPGATSTEIARRIRMTGADVFIIDYAQKMLPTKAQASLGDVVRYGPVQIEELKILAENEQAIGIIASQLTAAYQTVEPDAAAIRWLKELEEKANGVIYIWREVTTNNEVDKGTNLPLSNAGYKSAITRGKVTKQTMGATGYLDNIKLLGPQFRFVDY